MNTNVGDAWFAQDDVFSKEKQYLTIRGYMAGRDETTFSYLLEEIGHIIVGLEAHGGLPSAALEPMINVRDGCLMERRRDTSRMHVQLTFLYGTCGHVANVSV